MTRVLFVCHGNICRSPMAEFIFKDIVEKAHREDMFYVESAATSTEEIWNGKGNPVYPPARAELRKHGIVAGVDSKRARQVRREDYEAFDYLVCMEDVNVSNTLRILGGDLDGKVVKLLSFTGSDRNVADPWYSDRFDIAYNDIYEGCEALFRQLIK